MDYSRLDLDLMNELVNIKSQVRKLDSCIDEGVQLLEVVDPLPTAVSMWQKDIQTRSDALECAYGVFLGVLNNFDSEKRYRADRRCKAITVSVCIDIQAVSQAYFNSSNRLKGLCGELRNILKSKANCSPQSLEWNLKPFWQGLSIPCPDCENGTLSRHWNILKCDNCHTSMKID
jgi:hypothetical protein